MNRQITESLQSRIAFILEGAPGASQAWRQEQIENLCRAVAADAQWRIMDDAGKRGALTRDPVLLTEVEEASIDLDVGNKLNFATHGYGK